MHKYIGELLGNRYEILEIIGTGGMAVVYKARCTLLNRHVAIKILKEEYAKDTDFRKRFHNESQAVARLAHNNIVAIYDVSEQDELDYIVMELMDGMTLKEYLKKREKLRWQEALYFSSQIAKALEHAHQKGIIHQDIKPQNIILLRDGTVKVTDFGIAKSLTTQETKVVSEAIGSVHYISPEQAKGSNIDHRTDIYSLGVVMYELLTGRLPFEGDNPLAIVMQHISAVPLTPSDIAEDIPRAFDQLVEKCMSPIVSKRYLDVSLLIEDLELMKNDPDTVFSYSSDHNGRGDLENPKYSTKPLPSVRQDLYKNTRKNVKSGSAQSSGNGNRNRNRKSPILAAVIVVLVIVGISVSIAFNLLFSDNKTLKNKLSVPNLSGYTLDEIAEKYKDFNVVVSDEEVYNEKFAEGSVISQVPGQGEVVEVGATITVTISKRPEAKIEMPDFREKELKDTLTFFIKNDIEYIEKYENSDKVEKDKIISTDPARGEIIKPNEPVVVTISEGKGIKLVKVPNIVDMTLEEANKVISEAGLSIGTISSIPTSNTNSGIIVSQSVPKGVEVSDDTKIDIEVSSKIVVDVPDEEEVTPPDNTGSEPNTGGGGNTYVEGTGYTYLVIPSHVDVARVIVKLDGKNIYEKTHSASEGRIAISLTGNVGFRQVKVYLNDELWAEEVIDFK